MNETFFLTTGTDDFNHLFLDQGIKVDPNEGTSILIEGTAGVGKTTLALQLAWNSVNNGKAACLYYSFEQSDHEINALLKNFNWYIEAHSLRWEGGDQPNFPELFNIIDAYAVIGLNIEALLEKLEDHVGKITEKPGKPTIIVLDSIGAIESLVKLERKYIGRLINRLKKLKAVVILVREHAETPVTGPSEYITNVVIDLRVQYELTDGTVSPTAAHVGYGDWPPTCWPTCSRN